jgi:hypothetical protein
MTQTTMIEVLTMFLIVLMLNLKLPFFMLPGFLFDVATAFFQISFFMIDKLLGFIINKFNIIVN